MESTSFDYLVYIGRFQPFHLGHLAMLQAALQQGKKVILILGSAGGPRTTKNPFSVAERQQMIINAVAEWDASRVDDVLFAPVRDYYDGPRWVAAVQAAVAALMPADAHVGLFGHFKDASSDYLKDFPAWPLVHQANFGQINAADLRREWFAAAGDVTAITEKLPASVTRYLATFAQNAGFSTVIKEYKHLQVHTQQWSKAPYPPIFVTVDAVVRCAGHVLLIQRGGDFGYGCWALPGGFLDQNEFIADAAVRELIEETCLDVAPEVLKTSRRDYALFDHPSRSLRGRTVTHAFFFDLPNTILPAITAADDAAAARWVPQAELLAMESQFFEDHLLILDRFLGVFAV